MKGGKKTTELLYKSYDQNGEQNPIPHLDKRGAFRQATAGKKNYRSNITT